MLDYKIGLIKLKKMEETNKVFLNPGDVVQLKQDIPNKPKMIVVKKMTSIFKHDTDDKRSILKGIKCIWFTSDGTIQEYIFNTKDLQLL